MTGIWQAATIFFMGVLWLPAVEAPKLFVWNPPKVAHSLFTRELGLLDSERDEYATNLSSQAVNQVVAAKASAESLADARRMIALALHLSPRNKRAIVANFQLGKGLLPEVSEGNYSPQVFARLLLTRGQLLAKQEGAENERLARLFLHLASALDPKNEEAVYASELDRLDHGPLDWAAVTDTPAPQTDRTDGAQPRGPSPRPPSP
jgi:hypothetical protein